jgi:uncharacterized protein with GYD domain
MKRLLVVPALVAIGVLTLGRARPGPPRSRASSWPVPIYISLMNWTSQGIGGLPAWRDRVDESERVIAERGGKLIDIYVTLGRYDVVEIFDAPDDETAYGILLDLARHGQVRTETLRAFTRDEAEAIVRQS